jgi:hypothetical protein
MSSTGEPSATSAAWNVHPATDPFVRALVDETLVPFAAPLDAEELDWARAQLETLLGDDPHAAALLRACYPRDIDRSGEQLVPGAEVAEGADARKAQG